MLAKKPGLLVRSIVVAMFPPLGVLSELVVLLHKERESIGRLYLSISRSA